MAKSKQTDKLTRSRRQHPRRNAHTIDQFLMLLNENFSQRAAARICLLKEGSVTRLLSQPSVKERQEELKRVRLAHLKIGTRSEQAVALPCHSGGLLSLPQSMEDGTDAWWTRSKFPAW
jgi:hypothetical protein